MNGMIMMSDLTARIRAGELLSAKAVADIVGITRQGVIWACHNRLTEDECVLITDVGWLIALDGAKRLWPDAPWQQQTKPACN